MHKQMKTNRRKKHLARSERGQSLVEMTLGFIVLLILVSGVLDLGRVYFTFVALEDAAGEGALYMALNPDCAVDDSDPSNGICDDPDNAEFRMKNAGGQLLDWESDVTITMDPDPSDPSYEVNAGDTVTVEIAYPFELLTPFIPRIAGAGQLTLTAVASQRALDSTD